MESGKLGADRGPCPDQGFQKTGEEEVAASEDVRGGDGQAGRASPSLGFDNRRRAVAT